MTTARLNRASLVRQSIKIEDQLDMIEEIVKDMRKAHRDLNRVALKIPKGTFRIPEDVDVVEAVEFGFPVDAKNLAKLADALAKDAKRAGVILTKMAEKGLY